MKRGRRAPSLLRHALVALACAFALPAPAAQDPQTTEAALMRLVAALERDGSLSPEMKEALLAVAKALQAERAATPGAAPTPEAPAAPRAPTTPPTDATVLRRVEPSGDFRYRHETTDPGTPGSSTLRQRERLRLRAGLTWRPHDQWTIAGQLQTGPIDDPKSPHATLGNAFRTLPVSLSLAAVTWQPSFARNLRLTGGKFNSPFVVNPIFGEILWDADARPEGGVAAYSRKQGALQVNAAVGYYVVQERSASLDPGAFVAQVALRTSLGKKGEAALALGYHGFNGPTSNDPGTLLALAPGNSMVDTNGDGRADRFAADFQIWNPIAWLRVEAAGRPLTLGGELLKNTGADAGRDTGFTLGVSYGALRNRWDWLAYYDHVVVEQDAVFALLSQDDFTRTTGFSGNLFGARLQLFDKANLHTWAMSAKPKTSKTSADWRVRVDLNVAY